MNKRSSEPSSPRLVKLPKMDDSIDLPTATTGKQAISSHRPDANERRYDRQLRLWASSGQRSLEQANVLLIGCDAAGTQALKNLVLPGISSFTILSDQKATAQDVATNFFLAADSVGRLIADETVKYLGELNPAVSGTFVCKDVATIFSGEPDFFRSFTLIIASNLSPSLECQIGDALWQASSSVGGPDIPLVLIRSSGFIGRIEIQVREHCVVDTHPDTTHTLRIDAPFPALQAYAEDLDLASMDSMEHSHVPWVVLLVKAASIWMRSHDGQVPRDLSDDGGLDEQKEFKALLNGMRHKADEENFDEANAQAYQVWGETQVATFVQKPSGSAQNQISQDLQLLLEDAAVCNISKESKNVHLLLAALREYLKGHNLPPVAPTLPDMHSSTTSYLALQGLYRAQFQRDLQEFRIQLGAVLGKVGLPEDAIPDIEIESFVKNTSGVALIKGTSISSRRAMGDELRTMIDDNYGLDDWPVTYGTPLHLSFLAADHVHSTLGRWPGTDKSYYEADLTQTQSALSDLVKARLPSEVQHCAQEIVRGGFSTLPTTAALLGGLAAQEAIKLVTSQYAPLDNTCIVDLVHSTMAKFKL